nr:Lar family restriction alleviation protein [Citrobacter werkmanii]
MTTITRERLLKIQQWRLTYGPGSNVVLPAEEAEELARIALASLEAEPVLYAAEETLAYAKHGELHLTCLSEPMGDAVIPLYATPPAQRMPDMNGFRPCPFCNSPVKWCGENCVDPDDEHVCHHIQCTNPECGADFDFINTGDDLLPDDPETLDAMTAAECLQPLRKVCLNRFNSRASMLQAGNDSSNGKPLTITLPDASSKAFWSGTGKGETFHPETYKRWVKEAIERACAIARIDVEVK